MTTVRDSVRLHPTTVTDYQSHVRTYRKQSNQHKVISVKVDRRVWLAAMKIAKGDSTRIKVFSPVDVLVVNQSKKVR